MARLLSVNVGLPCDLEWKGRTVHTAIWKAHVSGACRVNRLNLEGDGQGDLAGHGGEQRAVFVYQIESYRYWQEQLRRTDFAYGQFGENFTVEGMPDDVVCIGDRFQIGSAVFEVTRPRVTCYRVGIRLDEPRMPALLTSSGRPGFYLRVLQEDVVKAGDEIVKAGEAEERMTVSEINGLLYLPHPALDRLKRTLRLKALSPGWHASFEAMLQNDAAANAGLAPKAAAHPAKPGFHHLEVCAIREESADVLSFTMRSPGEQPLPMALPGQYVALRLQTTADGPPLFRSYSLSGPISSEQYRISVKIEPNTAAGSYLKNDVRVGGALDVSSPRGSFTLQDSEAPILLLSAGIGVTPLLAMLYKLAESRSQHKVVWIYAARDRNHHPFAAEARGLLLELPNAASYIAYSRPETGEPLTGGSEAGGQFEIAGHLSLEVLKTLDIPSNADAYLCGPGRFLADMKQALASVGLAPGRIFMEVFNGGESLTPGIASKALPVPHLPENDDGTGPLVSFTRSGIAVRWHTSRYQSILELAEACDVPTRWSCRSGVCHNCESGLISGEITYAPTPLEDPANGNLLICCSQPLTGIAVDL